MTQRSLVEDAFALRHALVELVQAVNRTPMATWPEVSAELTAARQVLVETAHMVTPATPAAPVDGG